MIFALRNCLLDNYFCLSDQILKPLRNIQIKITIIAIAIFCTLTSFYLIYQSSLWAKNHQVNFYQDDSKQVPSPIRNLTHKNEEQKQVDMQAIHISNTLVWKEIVPAFPKQEEAKEILSHDSITDPLLRVLSSFDRQIRMKSENPISSEEFLSFYLNQMMTSTQKEQNAIKTYLKNINIKLKRFGIQLPEKINFIRTTGKEEIPGTWAYCRHHTIVFNNMSEQLLAHELFHIYSRCNPEMRQKLYALIGYHVIPPLVIPDSLKEKRIVNPDLPYLDAYINVKYQGKIVQAIPVDLYDLTYQGQGKSKYFQGIYHKFAMLEMQDNREFQFKLDAKKAPILFDFEEAEDLETQIGKNTSYVDSPEEILADNFAMMIMGNNGKSPELIEKMKVCFLEAV